jgi:RNA polymerase sigma-70 factor (ECF subfamily)
VAFFPAGAFPETRTNRARTAAKEGSAALCSNEISRLDVVSASAHWYVAFIMQGEPLPARPSAGDAAADAAIDNPLMEALARGDQAALATIYDRHAGVLLAVGLRILGDRIVAEDVLHDVFLEAWHHAADFDPARGSVRAWLVTRMRSRALDRRATAARQARLASDVKREIGAGEAVSNGESPIDGERVRAHIAGLPAELGAVIELAYFDGLSSTEIAARLGIPVGTVKSRTARALATLRAGLLDREGDA